MGWEGILLDSPLNDSNPWAGEPTKYFKCMGWRANWIFEIYGLESPLNMSNLWAGQPTEYVKSMGWRANWIFDIWLPYFLGWTSHKCRLGSLQKNWAGEPWGKKNLKNKKMKTPMNSQELTWAHMSSHEHPWTPMNTHEHPWTPMNTHEHPWTPMNSHEHPWIHMNNHEFTKTIFILFF